MKRSLVLLMAVLMIALALPSKINAVGWPANYEGVMLQAFYWDSYQTETKWTKLEARADELAPYFKLLWIPNSGKSSGGLGYMPKYWFTNHNSDMGSEAQLLSMIATYKAKGVGMIADVILNHRDGVNNWADFPTETWNGKTWKIGMDGICRDDEINNPGNPGGATGAYDEGEHFDGCRDLDHTNANVQENCKNYCLCLLQKYGYVGFRLDMVKGYSGYYTKMYNQYAKPTYSVGEYFDSDYDRLAGWIESTGWESAAFDFAFKYAVNDAFHSGDLTKLVWMENGTTPKPAGLIHHWYPQMAVTFIDNHDTFRDGSKFNGNWAAANAFMICSPGTPCVFLPHWNACGDQIAKMIEARNLVGVTNTSDVRVLKTTSNCYMAEVTGTRGKLVVKIGPNTDSPAGYSDSQIYCSGEDYCIWTTVSSVNPPNPPTPGGVPSQLYVMGNLAAGSWQTNVGVGMSKIGSKFTAQGVELKAVAGETKAFFTFVTQLSTKASDWDYVNSGDRYGAATKDAAITKGTPASVVKFAANVNASGANSWGVAPGTYDITVDFDAMTVTLTDPTTAPAQLYILGNLKGGHWTPHKGIAMTKSGNVFTAEAVEFEAPDEVTTLSYFSFVTALGADAEDWNTVNSSHRFGAEAEDHPLTPNASATLVKFPAGVNASGAYSWSIQPGKYKITVDFNAMTVKAEGEANGIGVISTDTDSTVRYYNLLGVPVANPTPGIYIQVIGNTARKVLVK